MQAIVTAPAQTPQLAASATGVDTSADPALAGLFGHLVAAAGKSGTVSDQTKPDPAPGSDAMAQILAGALMGVQPQPQTPLAAPTSVNGDPTQDNGGAALLLAAAASNSGSTAAPAPPASLQAGADGSEPASPNAAPPQAPAPPSPLSASPLPTSPLPAPARTDRSPPPAAARNPDPASFQIASNAQDQSRVPAATPTTPDQPKVAAVPAARTDSPARPVAPTPAKADPAPAATTPPP